MSLKTRLKSGIPEILDYTKHLDSTDFKKIEQYSDNFISKVGDEIATYNSKWVRDPLHQWSRQWEYPFVIQQIEGHRGSKKDYRVLDLGSGVTFLPYYLKDILGVDEVVALDYDLTLKDLFFLVNKKMNNEIKFAHQDIRELDRLSRGLFDVIYSVSVLEHTSDYESIIEKSHTLLKKDGIFVLTFDISLDGRDDITIEGARKLIGSVERVYGQKTNLSLSDIQTNQKILTSKKIATIDKKLLPWKYPIINVIKPIIKQRKIGTPYKNLTVCCIVLKK